MTTGHRIFPREHGTWAMLVVPWLVGCGVAGRMSGEVALLLAALVGWFLLQSQLMTWWRLRRAARGEPALLRRSAVAVTALSATALATTVPLLAGPRGAGLAAIGIAALVLSTAALLLVDRRAERGLPGQVLAAAGLALSEPAAWYVTTGKLDTVALALWLSNAAYFVAAVWYVRMLIAARARRTPLQSFGARLAFAAPTLSVEVKNLIVYGPKMTRKKK